MSDEDVSTSEIEVEPDTESEPAGVEADGTDFESENSDLRTVLQTFVGEGVDLNEFLNDNLTYKRDGTPVFRMPDSKEASESKSKSVAAPKRQRPRPQSSTSDQPQSQSKRDKLSELEKRFAEWQVS